MNPKKLTWKNILEILIPSLICLSLGFFIGQKTTKVESSPETSKASDHTQSQVETKIIVKELPEVHFFKAEAGRICPENYTIKAKFGTDLPIFYTSENKFYDRVKPELCFLNKERALEHGFTEKK